MSGISFQGNITVTTWNNTKGIIHEYTTTNAQDKLLKRVVRDMGKKEEVVSLSKKNANFLFKLIEKFIGKPVKNINNEKIIYNGSDNIVLSDRNPALFDGVRVEVDLDKSKL